MRLHPFVEDVLATGLITSREGAVPVNSSIPRDECELIYRMVEGTAARTALEVGMAFGVSTLCLCDALCRNAARTPGPSPKLFVMDPAQTWKKSWNSVGLDQIERAGFREMVEFYEETSQAVLPALFKQGVTCDLAFIDGWHTFDHTLVDFFYVDRMLGVGGVVVFDDVGFPAINSVLRFVLTNRDYEVVESLSTSPLARPSPGLRPQLKRWMARLARTDRTPLPEDVRLLQRLEGAHSVAVRKRGPDSRRFDHYRTF